MACHRGGNNRLDDHGMGPVGRGGGRGPKRLGWGREMPIPGWPWNACFFPLYPCRSLTVLTPERLHTCKAAPPIHGADDRIPAPPAHPGAGGNAKQRGDRMSTEQTRRSFTETSPAPGPDGGRASPGLLFFLLPLSTAALGGLTVGGFLFVIAAAAFLSDRAAYGAALSVYGTVITLLPCCPSPSSGRSSAGPGRDSVQIPPT